MTPPAGDLWLFVAGIAGMMVLVCLRIIADDLRHNRRWIELTTEAQRLRDLQVRRLREINARNRQAN